MLVSIGKFLEEMSMILTIVHGKVIKMHMELQDKNALLKV
jgi:hypothetical protein